MTGGRSRIATDLRRDRGAPVASHSGLRGRPGGGLDRDAVEEVVGGLLELLTERELPRTLGLARDARPSGSGLAAEVIETATSRGADVIDFGIVCTPTAKLAARRRELGGAVVVTGSHLGPEWNGLKLVAAPEYRPLDVRALPRGQAPPGRACAGSVRQDHAAAREHAAAVCASVDADAIRRARLRVRVSGGCGHATQIALEQLGCRFAEPQTDVGLLLDADGDRLQLVDEGGTALDPEAVLPLAAIARGGGVIVKGADTSRMVDDLAAERGWSVHVSHPGELHLLTRLAEADGDLAGEGNGGVVIPAVGLARDALACAASILDLMARTGMPLSRLAAGLPRFVRRRVNLPCAGEEPAFAALAALADRTGAELVRTYEGVRLERGEAWALVRQSATEPVLRITVEAPDDALADDVFAEVWAALRPRA